VQIRIGGDHESLLQILVGELAQMIRAADAVEARILGLDRLGQEVVGWKLLMGIEVEVARGPPLPMRRLT